MVEELCCGPCLAMEIRAPDAPVTFRDFVGPADPVSCLEKGGEMREELYEVACVVVSFTAAAFRLPVWALLSVD